MDNKQNMNIMRKQILILSMLALIIAGCQKDFDKSNESDNSVKPIASNIIKAGIEGVAATKATEKDGAFSWQSNDSLAVYTEAGTWAEFFLTDGAGTKSATFAVNQGDEGYVAKDLILTPASLASKTVVDVTAKKATIQLPYNYKYVEGALNSPMYAYSSDGNLSNLLFKHLGAILKVTYYNVPAEARSLAIESADKKIWGAFEFDYSASEPKIETSDIATSQYVYVNFEASDIKDTMSFYVPLPIGEYNALKTYLMDGSRKMIYDSYALFDRTKMKGTPKGAINVVRKNLVTLPQASGKFILDPSYSIIYLGQNASSQQRIRFIPPYKAKWYYDYVTKEDFETKYGSNPARVIYRSYYYSRNLLENFKTYAFNLPNIATSDYVFVMSEHNDDGFQNPTGYYAVAVIPKTETPSAEYSAWLGDYTVSGKSFDGSTHTPYTISIKQAAPNKTFSITGWGSTESSGLSAWEIIADYDEVNDALNIKNSMIYPYNYEYPASSGLYNGFVMAVGMVHNGSGWSFVWPSCPEYAATMKKVSGTITIEGTPNFGLGKPANTIAFYVTTPDGKTRGYFTSPNSFIQFPATVTKN